MASATPLRWNSLSSCHNWHVSISCILAAVSNASNLSSFSNTRTTASGKGVTSVLTREVFSDNASIACVYEAVVAGMVHTYLSAFHLLPGILRRMGRRCWLYRIDMLISSWEYNANLICVFWKTWCELLSLVAVSGRVLLLVLAAAGAVARGGAVFWSAGESHAKYLHLCALHYMWSVITIRQMSDHANDVALIFSLPSRTGDPYLDCPFSLSIELLVHCICIRVLLPFRFRVKSAGKSR